MVRAFRFQSSHHPILWESIHHDLHGSSLGLDIMSISFTGWWCNVPILKMMDFVNGKDDIPYIHILIKEHNPNVWNHQAVHHLGISPTTRCSLVSSNLRTYFLVGMALVSSCDFGIEHSIWNNVPSGKLTVCYWKLPFIVDLHIKKFFFLNIVMLVYQRVGNPYASPRMHHAQNHHFDLLYEPTLNGRFMAFGFTTLVPSPPTSSGTWSYDHHPVSSNHWEFQVSISLWCW